LTGGPDFYFPEPEFYAVLPLFVEIFSSFAKYLQTEAARIASEAGQLSSAPEIVDPRLKNKVSSRAEPKTTFIEAAELPDASSLQTSGNAAAPSKDAPRPAPTARSSSTSRLRAEPDEV
jgi:hypothetical protein